MTKRSVIRFRPVMLATIAALSSAMTLGLAAPAALAGSNGQQVVASAPPGSRINYMQVCGPNQTGVWKCTPVKRATADASGWSLAFFPGYWFKSVIFQGQALNVKVYGWKRYPAPKPTTWRWNWVATSSPIPANGFWSVFVEP